MKQNRLSSVTADMQQGLYVVMICVRLQSVTTV